MSAAGADRGVDAALKAQATARANAEAQQRYMAELMAWEKKARVKDEGLKKVKAIVQSSLPPIRNSGGAGPVATKTEKSDPQDADSRKRAVRKEKPIPGGDFRAWDKFDVEKALEELDADDTAVSKVPTDEDAEMEARRAQLLREHAANEEKDKGNAQFKQGKYAAAIACYTRGISHDPSSAPLVANRAMAHLKMKNYDDAERDCTAAIELAPTYVKAWFRRATARAALNKLEDALNDFKMVLKLDPKDKVARTEAAALPKRIAEAKEKARLAFRPLAHAGDDTTLSATKSEYTLHRIPIEEIGGSDDDDDGSRDSASGANAAVRKEAVTILPNAPQAAVGTTDSVKASADPTTPATLSQSPNGEQRKAPRKVHIEEVDDSDSDDDAGGGAQRAPVKTPSSPAVVAAAAPASAAVPVQKTQIAEQATSPAGDTEKTITNAAVNGQKTAKNGPRVSATEPLRRSWGTLAPTGTTDKMTAAKFEVAWRRTDDEGVLNLLLSVRPAQLPLLIKSNLCAELLVAIFRALALRPGDVPALDVLESVATAKRFDQTLMFLDDKELQPLKTIVTVLREGGGKDSARVDKVAKLYHL